MQATCSLPVRDGVGASCIALPDGPWLTLADFLAQRFPAIAYAEWLLRMQRGDVLDAHGTAIAPDQPYRPHERIYYYRNLPQETRIPFDATILYQDDHLVVADKPHFLPVTPGGRYLQETLLVRLKRLLDIDTLTPLHRIDRETAGLVLFCIQPQERDRYHALFRERNVAKSYEAIAPYRPELMLPLTYRNRLANSATSFMKMQPEEGEPNAETSIDLLEISGDLARYQLRPVTGQRHQLRAHMDALGIPILNDRIYPQLYPQEAEADIDYSRPLQLLAKSLTFSDPFSGQLRQFESRLQLQF